jgi:hypothetical protein
VVCAFKLSASICHASMAKNDCPRVLCVCCAASNSRRCLNNVAASARQSASSLSRSGTNSNAVDDGGAAIWNDSASGARGGGSARGTVCSGGRLSGAGSRKEKKLDSSGSAAGPFASRPISQVRPSVRPTEKLPLSRINSNSWKTKLADAKTVIAVCEAGGNWQCTPWNKIDHNSKWKVRIYFHWAKRYPYRDISRETVCFVVSATFHLAAISA